MKQFLTNISNRKSAYNHVKFADTAFLRFLYLANQNVIISTVIAFRACLIRLSTLNILQAIVIGINIKLITCFVQIYQLSD